MGAWPSSRLRCARRHTHARTQFSSYWMNRAVQHTRVSTTSTSHTPRSCLTSERALATAAIADQACVLSMLTMLAWLKLTFGLFASMVRGARARALHDTHSAWQRYGAHVRCIYATARHAFQPQRLRSKGLSLICGCTSVENPNKPP